jgi:hypothetical protein
MESFRFSVTKNNSCSWGKTKKENQLATFDSLFRL